MIDDYSFETSPERKTLFYGNTKMTKGKYWWKIEFKEIFCCQDSGITTCSLRSGFWKSKPETYHETIGLPDIFPGEITGPGYTSCNNLKWLNHVFIFYLDMDAGRFVIFNENLSRLINDVKVTFATAIPFFYANKHGNTIKLVDAGEGALPDKWMNMIPKAQ